LALYSSFTIAALGIFHTTLLLAGSRSLTTRLTLTIKNKDKQQDKLAASSAKYLSTNNGAYDDQDVDYDDDSANYDQHSVSQPPTSLTIRLPVFPKYAPEYRYFQISKYDIEYRPKITLLMKVKPLNYSHLVQQDPACLTLTPFRKLSKAA